jgi:hypothetical protein
LPQGGFAGPAAVEVDYSAAMARANSFDSVTGR